ncbi:MAG TPA: rhodanese-like domain-containing protein [Acidobacteriaceae bacterium]|nr:rhodanese-like domain-containing protein [Acidobacteriaceae bacterium]
MNVALTIVAIIIWGWLAVVWIRRIKARREIERLSITPEALHDLIVSRHDVLVLDARQPLDLLADSEIIEGAQRIAPQDAMDNPAVIPTDKELVVYCTCPSDKTSRAIAMKAHQLAPNVDINRVRFLKGGLAAWKAKGYPVVPYDKTFRLDTGT